MSITLFSLISDTAYWSHDQNKYLVTWLANHPPSINCVGTCHGRDEYPVLPGIQQVLWRSNGQFQCLAKFLLKHEKQIPSLELNRSYQK